MRSLLIVYHSRTDGTRQMAEAVARAAGDEAEARLTRADEATAEDLLNSDGYIFAAPENLAAIAGVMKDFFDRTYYDVLGQIEGPTRRWFVPGRMARTLRVRPLESRRGGA